MTDFKLLITDWYRQNKRELPWRETTDPFKIWLSEVILQQTRVDQGLPYYERFTQNFPDVQSLANAEEQQVLQLWQGLGYYSRGRNLHQTAKIISEQLKGQFPSNSAELQKLKGIGPYTASAIASFCFQEVTPVVDGNVNRVLARVFDIELPVNSTEGEKAIKELAGQLIDTKDPATYNQAIMEFGALMCTPANPNCDACPLISMCLAKQNGTIGQRPVKIKKQKIKNRHFHFALIGSDKEIVIEKRTARDIWQHLYQFPLTETASDEVPENLMLGLKTSDATEVSQTIKHILSHQHIHAKFYHFNLDQIPQKIVETLIVIDRTQLVNYPLPRLIDKYLHSV